MNIFGNTLGYDALVNKLKNDTRQQRADEVNKMLALNMNKRPSYDGISIAGGSLINAGDIIGRQQAFDRNRAFLNNPNAVLQFLSEGTADVGGPRAKKIMKDRPRFQEDVAQRGLEQVEYDADSGRLPSVSDIRKQAMLQEGTTRSGRTLESVRGQAGELYGQRESLLGGPWQEPILSSIPVPQAQERDLTQSQFAGDVRPIRPMRQTVSRDKRSLIPTFTNY